MAFNVLKNKYVFYVLFVIAVGNLLGYLAIEDYESLTLFVAIYALSTYFSKNTIINLSAAILGTALVRAPMRRKAWPWYEREGLENKEKKEDSVAAASEEEEDEVTGKNLMALGGNLAGQFQKIKNKIGSEGGIKALVSETKDLSQNQEALMEQMQSMAPLMANAEKLLKTFESTGMMKMVDRVLPFMEKMALPGMGASK